jgi:hypothetical protein
MSKHTPGPWSVSPPWMGFSVINGSDDKMVFAIAAGSPEEKRPDDECEANARLIAAAPEMLEALKVLLDEYLSLVNSGDCGFWDAEKDGFVINARAVITKAEGNQ